MAVELSQYSTLRNDANLVAYYKLENVNDEIASQTLTNVGTTGFSAGKFNNCASFGTSYSSGKALIRTDCLGINLSAGFSCILWYKQLAIPATGQSPQILGIYDDLSATKSYYTLTLDGQGSDVNKLSLTTLTPAISTTVSLGSTWHQIVITSNGTNSVKLYLDASLLGTATYSGGAPGITGVRIGDSFGSQNCMGEIDDIAFFSRVLTATEITNFYNATGSSIKTINGLAKASVKTVNGLAIASVKTWNSLA